MERGETSEKYGSNCLKVCKLLWYFHSSTETCLPTTPRRLCYTLTSVWHNCQLKLLSYRTLMVSIPPRNTFSSSAESSTTTHTFSHPSNAHSLPNIHSVLTLFLPFPTSPLPTQHSILLHPLPLHSTQGGPPKHLTSSRLTPLFIFSTHDGQRGLFSLGCHSSPSLPFSFTFPI